MGNKVSAVVEPVVEDGPDFGEDFLCSGRVSSDDDDQEEDASGSLDVLGRSAMPAYLWKTLNSVSASIKNFAPHSYVRDGMNLALASVTATRLRRKTLAGPELDVANFVAQTTAVDFSSLLSAEMIVHIAQFVDGEDLVALERTSRCLCSVVGGSRWLWRNLFEAKRRQITFVPFMSENQRVAGCRNWEEKHRYFRSCVWNATDDLSQALLVALHTPLGGEIHLLSGTYRSLLLEGWSVDLSIIGHGGDVVIENTSAWRPPIHICSESSLNPSTFMREQLSYVAKYMPETLSRMAPVSSSILPEYLTGLFRSPSQSPTIVLEGLRVQVGAVADQVSTFPVYIEGNTHVIIHKCTILGQRLSAVLVSKGAICDVIDSDIGHAAEDGVFYVHGGGSVRGCRLHDCAMNAVEVKRKEKEKIKIINELPKKKKNKQKQVRGLSRDLFVENNVITRNGCGLHVPWKGAEPATGLGEAWSGKVAILYNCVCLFSQHNIRDRFIL
jgi:hypothetical protein